jgi:hypothetical protein
MRYLEDALGGQKGTCGLLGSVLQGFPQLAAKGPRKGRRHGIADLAMLVVHGSHKPEAVREPLQITA